MDTTLKFSLYKDLIDKIENLPKGSEATLTVNGEVWFSGNVSKGTIVKGTDTRHPDNWTEVSLDLEVVEVVEVNCNGQVNRGQC